MDQEVKEDQHHHQFFNQNPQTPSSSLSLSSCPAFLNIPPQDQAGFYYREPVQEFQLLQPEGDKMNVFHGGSSISIDHHQRAEEIIGESDHHDLKLSIWKSSTEDTITTTPTNYDNYKNHIIISENNSNNKIDSVKWMSSKMRMMRKMIMNPDHQSSTTNHDHKPINFTHHSDNYKFDHFDHQVVMKKRQPASPLANDHSSSSSSNNNNNNTIRVCADCNTTRTPLWRSGPRGPKSLCNACGIRQRKARRAMAAAANGTILAVDGPTIKSKVQHKEKKSRSINGVSNNGRCVPQFNKRCKLTSPSSKGRKKLCFEDLTISVSKNISAFQQVFPQDERDAAILLMALSYGLVRG